MQPAEQTPPLHHGEPWESWYEIDEDGYITDAGVDTAKRLSNVCVTTCENVEVDDKDLFNAYVRKDTELIRSSPELLAELRSFIRKFDRDNVPERQESSASGDGVLVFVTHECAGRIRKLINRTLTLFPDA